MAKQFTKVTRTYATKNKLQLLILNELECVNNTLHEDKKVAIYIIKKQYEFALSLYTGKAAIPPLQSFQANENDLVYYVEDVIHISIYNVENDLS